MNVRGSGTWIGGTAVVAVLALIAGWFLLLSPLREDTAATRSEVDTVEQQNGLLEIQVAGLEADHAKLDDHRAELETLRAGVPATLETSALLRELDTLAQSVGVQLKDLTFAAPMPVVPPAAPVAPAAPVDEDAGDPAAAAPAEVDPAAPVAPTSAAPGGLLGVNISLTVLGSPEATGAFFTGLQDGSTRLFLVEGFNLTRQDEQSASGGQAAVVAGDLQTSIHGTVYVLPAAPTAPPAPAPVAGGDGSQVVNS